jgi:hypothetical protein
MLVMNSKVEIGAFLINSMVECSINSSWENLTDTATLVIPKKLSWKGKPIAWTTDPVLRKEDIVKISLGYDDRLHEVFKGYITQIKTEAPIELTCQDEMLLLKKKNYSSAYRSVTLSRLLSDMLKPIGIKYKVVADYEIGSYRTKDGATVAQILDQIRKDYFCQFFFRDGILYAGLPYVAELQRTHKIRFNRNVVSSDLEYMVKDDIKIKMKCVILYPNNKKKEFEIGDIEGEVRTFHKYDIPEAEMKRLATIELERLRYDGYRGSIEIFGEPNVRHGDIVEFINDDEPERTGKYLIKKVESKFSRNGYRQRLYPEGRVS